MMSGGRFSDEGYVLISHGGIVEVQELSKHEIVMCGCLLQESHKMAMQPVIARSNIWVVPMMRNMKGRL